LAWMDFDLMEEEEKGRGYLYGAHARVEEQLIRAEGSGAVSRR
jgi:hypothetical protein